MINVRKMLGEEFVETTLNDLREKGHVMYNLKAALSCTGYIFENVEPSYIEQYINEPEDTLFACCYSYLGNKYHLVSIEQFEKILHNQFDYESFLVRKPKFSPQQTFIELFRICYERKKQLEK